MDRGRIVDRAGDPAVLEMDAQRVAGRGPHHEEVVDVVAGGRRRGGQPQAAPRKGRGQCGGSSPATLVPLLEAAKLHPQDGGLERVEAIGACGKLVVVSHRLAVRSQQAHPAGEVRVAGHERAPVSPGAEVLGRDRS